MAPRLLCIILISTALLSGCHEELGIGTSTGELIEVECFAPGVTSVDESRLREVLATREPPWLPWVETRYFDRDALDRLLFFSY